MFKRLGLISRYLFLIILSASLAACATQSSLPTSAIAPVKVEPTFTLAPNTGSIRGVILIEQNGKYLPLKNTDLYLSKITLSASGITGVAGLDAGSDPRITTDDRGAFLFQNIKTGKYAIVVYLVTHAFLLNQTDKEASLIITVDTGKTTELGDLKYKTFEITPAP